MIYQPCKYPLANAKLTIVLLSCLHKQVLPVVTYLYSGFRLPLLYANLVTSHSKLSFNP